MKMSDGNIAKQLSSKIFRLYNQRNIVAIIAIAMTTVLFTTLFTIVHSLNSSYQMYTFRQIGSYSHGSFKGVNEAQLSKISKNKRVNDYGIRTYVGTMSDDIFSREPAEVSYMDLNTTKWSYIKLLKGREPQKSNEIAMDVSVLNSLGVPVEIGSKVKLTFEINDRLQKGDKVSEEFILVGYWIQDDILPIHYINISKEYAEQIEEYLIHKGGNSLRTDVNVMLYSPINIQGQMSKILEEESLENVTAGVNWGYSSSRIDSNFGVGTVISIIMILGIIILTAYLIISNIFYISVSSDIRFWGLLKAIGMTNKQLKKIVVK